MVFVHGRGQEFKNPAELERKWRAGLAAGLIKAAQPPLADVPVVFPFYANLLYQITAQVAQDPIELEGLPAGPDEAGPLHPGLPEDVGKLERELLANMADAAGAPAGGEEAFRLDRLLSWGAARDTLTWVARHTRVDQAIIVENLRRRRLPDRARPGSRPGQKRHPAGCAHRPCLAQPRHGGARPAR
jgi:hypothetical protein